MAAYFQLTKIGETEPSKFVDVDVEICRVLNEPVHEKYWVRSWYDCIGFGLAVGNSWDKLRETYADTDLIPVIDFLEANYTVSAWSGR